MFELPTDLFNRGFADYPMKRNLTVYENYFHLVEPSKEDVISKSSEMQDFVGLLVFSLKA